LVQGVFLNPWSLGIFDPSEAIMTKKIFFLPAFLLLSFSAYSETNKGGLFIEPMLTYERGEGEVKFPAPFGKAETESSGVGVGARLGFHIMESLFLGADGRYSIINFEDDEVKSDTDAKGWNVAPVIGIQMPTTLGIRLWGSYILAGELDPDKDKNVDLRFSEARGYRVGGGIKLAAVSLNLEYENLVYDKTNVDEVGSFTPGYSSDDLELDNSSWILSVSFPFSL